MDLFLGRWRSILIHLTLALGAILHPSRVRGETIAVLVQEKGLPEPMASDLLAAAAGRLSTMGWTVTDPETAETSALELARCVDEGDTDCQGRAVAPLGVRRVLLMRAQGTADTKDGPRLTITAWILDGETGERILSEQRYCEQCSTRVAELAHELVGTIMRTMASREGSTVLVLKSTPPGARVVVDGSPVGATDLEYGTYPGPHVVRFEKPGFAPMERTIQATAYQRNQLHVVLNKEAPLEQAGTDSRARSWKWLAAGGGIAALAAGGTLLALHEPGIEGGKRNPTERVSFWPGVVTLGAGAALVAVALVPWWSGGPAPSGAKARVFVGPHDVAFSLTGTF